MALQEWFENKDYGIGLALLGNFCKNRVLLQNLSRKKNPEKLEYELRKAAEHQGIVIGTVEEIDETKGLSVDHTNVPEAKVDQDGVVQDNLDKIESGAEEIVQDKLIELEMDAGDIVSDNANDLKNTAQNIVEDKIQEFETQIDEILAGKLEVIRNGRKVKFEDLSKEMQARWIQNSDGYKEIRALHEKLKLMEKASPEDRKPLTERICKLDDQIRDNWAEIDAFVAGEKEQSSDVLKLDHKRIQSNRKYISTNLKKLQEQQDPVKRAKVIDELQVRYNELKAAGETVARETIEELTKTGVTC